MSDATPTKKPGILARLREFVDSLGDIEDDTEVEADEAEVEADEAEVEADDIETDADEAEAIENTEGDDATPGTADENSAEDGDKDAIIREQAAIIETYRNTIAELGGIDPLEPELDADADLDTDDDTLSEDEKVAEFEDDYARQEAMLAELKEN
jgi:hypothetical protein